MPKMAALLLKSGFIRRVLLCTVHTLVLACSLQLVAGAYASDDAAPTSAPHAHGQHGCGTAFAPAQADAEATLVSERSLEDALTAPFLCLAVKKHFTLTHGSTTTSPPPFARRCLRRKTAPESHVPPNGAPVWCVLCPVVRVPYVLCGVFCVVLCVVGVPR